MVILNLTVKDLTRRVLDVVQKVTVMINVNVILNVLIVQEIIPPILRDALGSKMNPKYKKSEFLIKCLSLRPETFMNTDMASN